MLRVRVRVRVKIRVRFRFRVKITVRVRVRHQKMFCMLRVRVKIRVRFRVRISIILKRCSSPVLAHPPLPGNRQLLASAKCLDGIVPLASAHGVFRSWLIVTGDVESPPGSDGSREERSWNLYIKRQLKIRPYFGLLCYIFLKFLS